MPVVSTPFPDIAVQIIEAKGIAHLKTTDGGGFLTISPFGARAVGVVAIVVG
jgi:hypothetical protein